MITTYELYGGEVKIDFSDFNHVYKRDGKVIPSVTGITGVISKPSLLGWAVNKSVDYIAKSIKPGVALDEVQLVGLFAEAKKAHVRSRDEASDIGTLVHAWVRDYIHGLNPDVPINVKLQTSIHNFLTWELEHKVKFQKSEQVVYSRLYNYCGTFDYNAYVDDVLTLVDLKTSSGVYDEMFAQLAGYEQARNEEFPQEKYEKRGILWISRDGDFDFVESKFPDQAMKMFLGARDVYLTQKFYKDEYFKNKNAPE
jgi:hypothetical protein